MNKAFSFMAGALCGALLGSVAALLLTPASGAELKASAMNRWQMTVDDARQAMNERQRELEIQFDQATRGEGVRGGQRPSTLS